jgi:hypothetical protein
MDVESAKATAKLKVMSLMAPPSACLSTTAEKHLFPLTKFMQEAQYGVAAKFRQILVPVKWTRTAGPLEPIS